MYSIVEVKVSRRRRPLRKWRLRGRRGQVAAVATILGLLLVVTVIANYLTTTLPSQMSVNDLNHVVQVENEVGRLQALLEAASAVGAVGAQLTQPITLGSAGDPPFAAADSGSIERSTGISSFTTSLTGPLAYAPPKASAWGAGGDLAGCTFVTPTLTCLAGWHNLTYNITAAALTSYSVTTNLGSYFLNISDSGTSTSTEATIAVTASGSQALNLLLLGNFDKITVTLLTAASTVNLTVIGNNDSLTISNSGLSSQVDLTEVGAYDSTSFSTATNLTYVASIYGLHDSVAAPATAVSNAATSVTVYYIGFASTSAVCPSDNLASSDSVSGSSTAGSYIAIYNVSSPFTPTAVADWSQEGLVVTPASANCEFFSPSVVPLSLGGSAAGFTVHLFNTYLPQADVAFDEGGVVYAQSGGVPIMLDGPAISATEVGTTVTSVSIWFPVFVGSLATDDGVSTAEVATQLLFLNTIDLTPSSGTWLAADSNIVLTIQTPYAAAWAGFFNSTAPFNTEWSCSGPAAACSGPYTSGGPLGTVTLTIPTGTQLTALNLQVATFSIALV